MAKTLHANKPLTEEQINYCRMMTIKAYHEHFGKRVSYGISKGGSKAKGDDNDALEKRQK